MYPFFDANYFLSTHQSGGLPNRLIPHFWQPKNVQKLTFTAV